jgi:hypothetical protein
MFVFVGLFIALPGLLKYADDQAKQKAYENLPDGHRLMCNIPSVTFLQIILITKQRESINLFCGVMILKAAMYCICIIN